MKPSPFPSKLNRCGVAVALGCLSLFGILSPAARAADPPAAPAAQSGGSTRPAGLSNTTYASRTLRITSPGGAADVEAVLSRLYSLDVAGQIGAEVLGVSPEDALAAVAEPSVGRNPGEVELVVNFLPTRHAKARPAAKELVDRLVAKLPELLSDERRAQEQPRLDQANEWFARARHDYDAVLSRMREKQEIMGGLSPEGVRAALSKLEDERQRLELELAGMQARQRAVEEWIDRTSKQMEEQAKTDPVVAELEKAVAAQEQLVKMIRQRFESGVAPQTEVAAAEAKLSDVKIQLLDRKRGPAGGAFPAANDPLAALTRELQSLSIDTVDRKARLAFVEKRIAPLREAAMNVSDFELLEAERAALRTEMEQARKELRSAERAVRASSGSDRVVVVRSADKKPEPPPGSTRSE